MRIFKNIKIEHYEEKKRFLGYSLCLFLLFVLAIYFLTSSYATYQSEAKLHASIDQALYLFGGEYLTFNIDPDKIVPSDDPYIYKFSLANFTGTQSSDVDIEYVIKIRTTTNLPITLEMYRNENYDDVGATNILQGATLKQDEDSAWYRTYQDLGLYTMSYANHVTDIYSLVVRFPSQYAQDETYANSIENIEITINSNQVV